MTRCIDCGGETGTELDRCAVCEFREALRYWLSARNADDVTRKNAAHVLHMATLQLDRDVVAAIIAETAYLHTQRALVAA